MPSFGPRAARLLIVGLAPGLRGANATGRPFTGDYAGDLLFATLAKFGLSRGRYDARIDDGLTLEGVIILNSVKCLPPQNKPTPAEVATMAHVVRSFVNDCIQRLLDDRMSAGEMQSMASKYVMANLGMDRELLDQVGSASVAVSTARNDNGNLTIRVQAAFDAHSELFQAQTQPIQVASTVEVVNRPVEVALMVPNTNSESAADIAASQVEPSSSSPSLMEL